MNKNSKKIFLILRNLKIGFVILPLKILVKWGPQVVRQYLI